MICPLKSGEKNDYCVYENCEWFVRQENKCVIIAAYYKSDILITMLHDYLSRYFQIQAAKNSIKENKDAGI